MKRMSFRLPTLLRTSTFGLLCTASLLAFSHAPAQATVTTVPLHTFNSHSDGIDPGDNATLTKASDGNFYGVTVNGGTNSAGTVYRVTTAGVQTTLHSFTNVGTPADGYNPNGKILQGADGYLYGTCISGGTGTPGGTVWRIKTDGTSFKVVYTLSPYDSTTSTYPDGYNIYAGVAQDSTGYLYVASQNGGANGQGVLFKIKTDGTGRVKLHDFSNAVEGNGHYFTPTISGTTLYNTTAGGGPNANGGVYKISTSGSGFSVLHLFTNDNNGTEGYYPQNVLLAKDGKLYGTNNGGGTTGQGTLWTVSTSGSGFAVKHTFAYTSEGGGPAGTLLQDSGGTLYGTTVNYGPITGGGTGDGTVYKMKTDGTSFAVLHTFKNDASEGSGSTPGVVLGSDGKLYGVRSDGGVRDERGAQVNYGTIYSLSTSGSSFKVVLDFFRDGFFDGQQPYYAGVIQAKDGFFYGTTLYGGKFNGGTAYRMDTSGKVTVLHNFGQGGLDGRIPYANLVQGTDGNFYGSTYNGGTYDAGTVYQLKTDGSYSTIYVFGQAAGANLPSSLIQGTDGNLYGTSYSGGQYNYGAIFKMTLAGVQTILYSFKNDTHGANPNGGLIQGTDGYLYGTTLNAGLAGYNFGTVYQISTSGSLKTIYTFKGYTVTPYDGSNPYSGVVQAADGKLYGTASSYGANGYGSLYSLSTSGSGYKTIHSLAYATEGANPYASLIQGTDGRLYGTCVNNGVAPSAGQAQGTAFRISTSGSSFTLLHTFVYNNSGSGATEGYNPYSALLEAKDGNVYGTTQNGGVQPIAAPGSGTGASVQGTAYQIQTLLPIITSFSPSSAAPGASIVIKGVNFGSDSVVKFGNGTATSITINSSTQITATVPTSATDGPLNISTSKGGFTSKSTFKVLPAITSFSPTSGNAGTSVTINGGGFVSGATVKFNGKTATSVTFVSSTQLKAVVPSGVTTGKITVTVPNGTATSNGSFTAVPLPTITSFSPTSGSVGTTVTIVGTNLDTVTAVKFNGTTATQFLATDSTHISAKVPSGATTGKISVTNPSATVTSSGTFTVH